MRHPTLMGKRTICGCKYWVGYSSMKSCSNGYWLVRSPNICAMVADGLVSTWCHTICDQRDHDGSACAYQKHPTPSQICILVYIYITHFCHKTLLCSPLPSSPHWLLDYKCHRTQCLGVVRNNYALLNLRALTFSPVNEIHIFQCMAHTLKDVNLIHRWKLPVAIPHKISYPYIERYKFYTALEF